MEETPCTLMPVTGDGGCRDLGGRHGCFAVLIGRKEETDLLLGNQKDSGGSSIWDGFREARG